MNQKDHPPLLKDEVWRLRKIGKNGPLHKKLALAKIKTVQDFLRFLSMDPDKLRKVRKVITVFSGAILRLQTNKPACFSFLPLVTRNAK